MYYINYFFLYSILGHLIETIFVPNFNSGILYGWWTPVYGFGVVCILIIGSIIEHIPLTKKKLFKIFITYFSCMIILTLLELLGGYLIEWIFHQEFWNYEKYRFHIGPYISLEMANIWGIAGIIVLYILKPITDYLISYIPKWLTYLLLFLFFLDVSSKILSK